MPTIHVNPGSAADLQEIADTLGKSRKVVVVTGAGISTNCGIPDFRSENGLYSLIQAQYDAALQNPPWENTDNFDIDDRPKKKRRVTDRWYYEIVPGTGPAMNEEDDQLPDEQHRRSPASQSASQSTTGHSTPAATHSLESSPLSSPRSLTPQPPSEYLETESSSPKPHLQEQSSSGTSQLTNIASAGCGSPSIRSRSSISSTICRSNETSSRSKLDQETQSQSSTPSSTSTTDDSSSATKSEDEPASTQSSQPSSRQSLPNLKGRDLFDSMIWSNPFTTSIFYMFVSSLRQKIQDEVRSTTATHKFIRTLRDGGRLVRNYTQNIDSLEEREGLSTDLTRGPGNRSRFHSKTQRKPRPSEIDIESPHNGGVEVVLLHGSLVSLRCGICTKLSSWDHAERQSSTLAGSAPDCPACSDYNAKRTGRGRRGLAVGRLRPDIVLYGEEHPNANLVAPLITHDLALAPDFLLIMGTSLKVHGLKVMVKEFAKAVHVRGGKVVFVNRTKPPESTWGEFIDYWVEWDCDEWVLDLKVRRGDIWLPQGSLEESKSKPESPVDAKAENKKMRRPQAVRDDKMNGVYQTFKILDSLAQLKDSSGKNSSRPLYFDKAVKTFIAPLAKSGPARKAPAAAPVPSSSKASISKKRKSYPGALREDKHNAAFLVTKIWNQLRELAPGLDPTPPESGRIALSELSANFVMPSFNRSFVPSSNYYPNLAGLGPLTQINLITHPPSGATVPIHTPKSLPKPVTERKPASHGYSTRASRRYSTETTIVVDTLSSPSPWPSTEDTIVVATPPPQGPTPPTSDPMTPSTQRIKRIGSIGAILSSPEDSDRSSLEIYYDAVE